LAQRCGYTYPEIRAMTLADVYRQFSYWKTNPPLDVLVGAIAVAMGMKLPETEDEKLKKYPTYEEALRMAQITGGGRL
jgi:hypothetical protein